MVIHGSFLELLISMLEKHQRLCNHLIILHIGLDFTFKMEQ